MITATDIRAEQAEAQHYEWAMRQVARRNLKPEEDFEREGDGVVARTNQ